MTITFAQTDEQVRRCCPVLKELRPHLDPMSFLEDVRRLERQGYRLVYLEDVGEVKSVAGFRLDECFAWGKFMYVYDLVTRGTTTSRGYGAALLDWLMDHARQAGCAEFHLDSGVQRHDAHRFYFKKRMSILSHHFSLPLPRLSDNSSTPTP